MPGRGNFSSTVTRVLINSRTASMGSSMETGEFPESEGYEICISFFFLFSYRMKFRIFLEGSFYLFEIGVLDIGKGKESKKCSHVKTNRNRAHCI